MSEKVVAVYRSGALFSVNDGAQGPVGPPGGPGPEGPPGPQGSSVNPSMVPDFSNRETINRLPSNGGMTGKSWTADRVGFILYRVQANNLASVGGYVALKIGGWYADAMFCQAVGGKVAISGLFPISVGDVVVFESTGTEQTALGDTQNYLFFVPPKTVPLPVAAAYAPDYTNRVVNNKISSNNATWTVDKDGFVECWNYCNNGVAGTQITIFINDSMMAKSYGYSGSGSVSASGIWPVVAGDIVKFVSTAATQSLDPVIHCYWVPARPVGVLAGGSSVTYWKLTENGDSNLSGTNVGEYYGRMDKDDFEKIYGPNDEPQDGDVCFSATDKKISGVIQNPSPDDSNRLAVTVTQKEMPELLAVDSISKDQAVILEMENTGKDANGNDNGSTVGSDKPRIGDRYWVRIGWGVPLNVARFWTGRYKGGPVLTFITEGGKYPQNNKYLCILVSVAPPEVWVQEPVHLTTHLEELPLYEYNVATGQRRQQFGRTGKLLYAKLINLTLTTKGAGDEYDWQSVQDDFTPNNGYFLMGTEASTSYTESTLQSGSRYRDSDISVFSDDDEGLSVYYFDQEPTIAHPLTCTARLYFHKGEQV